MNMSTSMSKNSNMNMNMNMSSDEQEHGEQRRDAHHRSSGGSSRRSGGRSTNKSTNQKRKFMSSAKLSEEAALTERLFGSGGGGVAVDDGATLTAAWMDDDNDGNDASPEWNAADALDLTAVQQQENADLFAIDRSGEEVTEGVHEKQEDGAVSVGHKQSSEYQGSDSEEESVEEEEERLGVSIKGAAWHDSHSDSDSDGDADSNSGSDSDVEVERDAAEDARNNKGANKGMHTKQKKTKGVSLVDGPNRLKKLRRYRDETTPVSVKEYELRLRERFTTTASVAARTDWANDALAAQRRRQATQQRGGAEGGEARTKKKSFEGDDSDNDDSSGNVLESNASLFAAPSVGRALAPTLLGVARTRDGNLADPNRSAVSAVQFHPTSNPGAPLLMTAGMDKMLRFFKPTEEGGGKDGDFAKVHGISFPQMPIATAAFLGDSGSVVVSGRRPFFYVYDAVSGKIERVPGIVGRRERSLEKFAVSPDGRTIAFLGNDGYVVLVDGRTRRWMGDLKMNGSVRAVTFSGDGECVLGSGSDGDVYTWHIGSRRCMNRFHNEDGTITSSLAVCSNFLAVGAESGVVNLYDARVPSTRSTGYPAGGLALTATERKPLKSIMNTTTSADSVKFNHDGQILAMSTRREGNGLKLLHVPTATVFSNWPTSKTPLKYVWSIDFSPGSRYLAVGNDRGKCLLYRLKHYWDE